MTSVVFVNPYCAETRIVREMANHQCQVCDMLFIEGSNMAKSARHTGVGHPGGPVMGLVHHIDGNDANWKYRNLLYVCQYCDRKLKAMRSQTDDMPTKMTLILPDVLGEKATLVIERNELAHVETFAYDHENTVFDAIRAAETHLATIEANPPAMPPPAPVATPKPAANPHSKRKSKPAPKAETKPAEPVQPPPPPEPTYVLASLKGLRREIPQSHLGFPQVTGDEKDAALVVASRLLVTKLWDGEKAIFITDPKTACDTMSKYSDKELAAFYTLSDFASDYQPEAELETV